jgi:S1-C subfamily serine protease
MKLYRVIAVCAALLAPAAGASAQESTVATGRQVKGDIGFGLEFQISQTSGGMQRTGYPRVSSVRPGSSAQRVGLAVGDLLLSVDGRDTQRTSRWFADAVPGRRYTLRVRRGGTEREIVVEAGSPPPRN